MIPTVTTTDPTQFTDPAAQQKIAESVLNQLGLHPNQQGAKSLLDAHFQSPHAVPEVKSITQPLVSGAPTDDVSNPVKEETASATLPRKEPAAQAVPEQIKPVEAQAPSSSLPTIPPPSMNPIQTNTNNGIQDAQNEEKRLIDTGSGVSQIHNPFVKGLARVGDIAGTALFPSVMRNVPGTTAHHYQLINDQQALIDSGIKQQGEEATTAHTQEETQKSIDTPITPTELGTWLKQNPGKSISEFWEQKAKAQFGKLTPQQQTLRFMTLPIAEGGLGMDYLTAFSKIQQTINDAKPKNAAQLKQEIEELIGKTMPNGQMDPKLMSDPNKLIDHISQDPTLTPEEKSRVFSYLTTTNTPASQAGIAAIRTAPQMLNRFTPAINTGTGQLVLATPEMLHAAPAGTYIPATQGGASMSKESAFADIEFNTKNTEEAIRNLKTPLDTRTRAQILTAMRSTDPKRAFDQLLSSEFTANLSDDQIDLVTSVAAMTENAMALRAIQGLGQGSDELRSAITKMIPSFAPASKELALRQLEIFRGTVDRAKQGVPKSGVNHTEIPHQAKTTAEIRESENEPQQGTSRTFTKADIQAEVDKWNAAHPKGKITYDDAKKDAIAHGHKVTE